MKKRILALALAGTTAFSVFGAAMSANAAPSVEDILDWLHNISWNDSTHSNSGDSAYYHSYEAPGRLRWNVTSTGSNYQNMETGFLYAGPATAMDDTFDSSDNKYVLDANKVYGVSWNDALYTNTGKFINEYDETGVANVTYFKSYKALGEKLKYTEYAIWSGQGVDGGGHGQTGTAQTGGLAEYIIAEKDGKYYAFPERTWTNYAGGQGVPGYDNNIAGGERFYLKNGDKVQDNGTRVYTTDDLYNEFKTENPNTYFAVENGNVGASGMDQIDTNMQKIASTQSNNYKIFTGEAIANTKTSLVEDDGTPVAALSGASTDFETVMATPVASDGVIYLYDYPELTRSINANTIVSAFNRKDGSLEKLLDSVFTNDYVDPEDGPYSYYGSVSQLRSDVIYAWENFLDEIGISDLTDYGLTQWANYTLDNYDYLYEDGDRIFHIENIGDDFQIVWVSSEDVDLYNFSQLIEDIMNNAPSAKAADAQTSELVYLMQQYSKYVDGGYVEEKPVETNNWGDLLVTIAQAPTEDDFRTATAYKRYTNRVEDLVEAYEEASTAAAVNMAEANLYKFVTGGYGWQGYDDNGKEDTTALYNAIDSTYFNYKWSLSYDNGEHGDDKVTGTPEDYVGMLDTDGKMTKKNPSDVSMVYSYALYPKDDYVGTGSYQYPGVDTKVSGVTESYGWFINVFDLAYNVYVGNDYQGALDAMTTALNEAIDALVPATSQNARPSDILGAEEANEPLDSMIETDYTDAAWANRTKINTYINDRVSNEEIGRTGSSNAEEIAELVEKHLGYQRNQTVVTRAEINSVSDAMKNAQDKLDALEADDEAYNAAQATALKNAIDDCQYIIDIYEGDYALRGTSQTYNGKYDGKTGDKDQILKSDITAATEAVDSAINFANIIQGWSQDEDKNWKYGTEEGYLNDGWHQVDGGKTWFYFNEDGTAKQSDWWQDPATGTWYWFNSNCGAAVGWAKIDGDWYYFKGNNAMKTGWEKVEGSWYYMNSSGKMVTGWCQINGTWYYFSKESNALGQMLANTTTPDGYKVDANGALVE